MEIGDKVYVADWGQQYSDFYRWENNERILIWDWKTSIPDHTGTNFHWKIIREPKLTIKGEPYKDGSTIVKERIPVFKNFEYTILEKTTRKDGKVICLLSSNHTDIDALKCYVQIGEEGLSTLTPEERESLEALEKENYLKALAKQNLRKWSKKDNLKEFPEELLKVYYDADQRVLFGSTYTKGIVTYKYIPKEYTVKGKNPLLVYTEVNYNGKGCDLSDKDVINLREAQKLFNHD